MSKSMWLRTTMDAVRDIMVRRLEKHSLDPESEKEIQMALEELEVMWDELQGRAEMLTRENERYAEFFDYAPDAYVITDAGGNIREVNRAATELFGATRAELVGPPRSAAVPAPEGVGFLTRWVGIIVADATRPASWRGQIRGAQGAPVEVE